MAHVEHHAGPAHVAHHFETADQQLSSGKLGMWIFLATEVLLFGGLFTAYAVYRSHHPEIFQYAHLYLNKILGGINTLVLICSSLTMAWAVRAAQLGKRRFAAWLMLATLVFACAFLGIKYVEYKDKWEEGLLWGKRFAPHEAPHGLEHATLTGRTAVTAPLGAPGVGGFAGDAISPSTVVPAEVGAQGGPTGPQGSAAEGQGASTKPPGEPGHPGTSPAESTPGVPPAPAAANLAAAVAGVVASPPVAGQGGGDRTLIAPPAIGPTGMARGQLERLDRARDARPRNVHIFFGIYFAMTGLHGLHVLAGMAAIGWVLRRTLRGDFSAVYFTPVDLAGLYWHLVDLIWIFLFPLLYLIT